VEKKVSFYIRLHQAILIPAFATSGKCRPRRRIDARARRRPKVQFSFFAILSAACHLMTIPQMMTTAGARSLRFLRIVAVFKLRIWLRS
jgi:hypothetical protein